MGIKEQEKICKKYGIEFEFGFSNQELYPTRIATALQKAYQEGSVVFKWVDINERFPENDAHVLVCLNGVSIRVSYYFYDSLGHWFSTANDIWDQYYTGAVTHWSLLPEMPVTKRS